MSKLKKIIIAAIAVFVLVCVGLALKYNDVFSLNNPKYYEQAVDFYAKKDYQDAYYNFGKVKRISPLYVAALFRQAVCAEKLGDYPTAIKKYEFLIKKYPKSFFVPKSRYSLAKAYYFNKQYDEAEKTFKFIVKQGFVEDYIIASNYYLGLLSKKDGNNKEAKKYFVAYLELSPDGTYSMQSANELQKLNIELNSKENLLLGNLYYSRKSYSTAKTFLEKATLNTAWAQLALCYAKEGLYQKAKIIIEQGIRFYSKTVSYNDLTAAIDVYTNIYSSEPKQGLFKLSKLIQDNKAVGEDYVFYKLAQTLSGHASLNLYSKVAYKYPHSEYAPDSLWVLFWHNYQAKNYKVAKKIGNDYLKHYEDTPGNPRMLYWMGKLAAVQRKNTEANSHWNKLLNRYPDDYYAYRADSNLKGMQNVWGTKTHHKLVERETHIEFPISYSLLDIKDLKLINMLLEHGDYEVWGELNYNNKFVESWFEYKRGNKSRSILLAREALASMDVKPPFNDDIYKLAYPLYYVDCVNQNAERTNNDPYLVISLIREESYFNAQAKSKTGAVGLMQLMPSTASYVASKYNLLQPSVSKLLVPEKNIYYGCTYLDYVEKHLWGNDLLSVASYNGGPNAVRQWHLKANTQDLDVFVENIPYSETRNYVKKVYKSYWNYLNVYNF